MNNASGFHEHKNHEEIELAKHQEIKMATTPVNERRHSPLHWYKGEEALVQQFANCGASRCQPHWARWGWLEFAAADRNNRSWSQKKYNHPNSLPSSIKQVKTSNGSQVTSSVPGLGSFHDMSMIEMSDEFQISVVKTCVKKYLFHTWKFYQPDFQGKFDETEGTMCGFIMKRTGCKGAPTWWWSMRRIVVATLTLCRNNVIKNMGLKFKGKQNQATFTTSKLLRF